MNIGRPKRVIEVDPATVPLPEIAPDPQPAPTEPVPVAPGS
jgi:hypothetical protein